MTTNTLPPLTEEFRDYAWFGSGSGKIQRILKHPDFTVTCDTAKYFFLHCNYASPETNAVRDPQEVASWISATKEFERLALRPSAPPHDKKFDAAHAIRWAGSVIRAGYKMQEKFRGHPVIAWLMCPEAEGVWKGPDGFLIELYRRQGIMEKRSLIEIAIRPALYSESDALLYVLFRVYAATHCKPGSAAWKIAHEDVGKETQHGTLYSVPKNRWESILDRVKKSPHA